MILTVDDFGDNTIQITEGEVLLWHGDADHPADVTLTHEEWAKITRIVDFVGGDS